MVVPENTGDSQSQPPSQVQPTQAPAAPQVVTQPSLLSPPQLIELGKSYNPKTEQAVIHLENKTEKK